MRNRNRSLMRLALVAAATASFVGCDSGGSGGHSVTDAPLIRLEILPGGDAALLAPIGDLQFTATGTYGDGSTADLTETVTWTCSNHAVGTVSNDGGTRGLATFRAAGSTEITATDPATGVSAAVSVSVTAAAVELDISPFDASILIGSTLQLTATATLDDENGTSADVTSIVTWTSSDETVATISAGGLVTAQELGWTTITAVHPISGVSATTSVFVTDVLGLSYVALSRGSVIGGGSVAITGTVVLTAIATHDAELTLWSTNEDVVTVPGSVVVPAGEDRASFAVTTMPVTQKTRVFVWASDGVAETRASLNVRKQR
jgi:hypothetical protein